MDESPSPTVPRPDRGSPASEALAVLRDPAGGVWADLADRARVALALWLRTPAGIGAAVAAGALLALAGLAVVRDGSTDGGAAVVSLPLAPGTPGAGTGDGARTGGPASGGADSPGAGSPGAGSPGERAGRDGPSGEVPVGSSGAAVVWVHVAGSVARPGLYGLPANARVADAVQAAGGLSPDADVDRINLAAPLADGSRLYLPALGETEPPPVVDSGGGSSAAGTTPAGGAGATTVPGAEGRPLVDLNTATADQLDELPGVGPATAAAIIEHRERNGPFRSVDQLADVKGIGDAKLAQLRDLVTV